MIKLYLIIICTHFINKLWFNSWMENTVDPDQMKPADLDLQCYQNRINQGSAEHGLRNTRTIMERNVLSKAHGKSWILVEKITDWENYWNIFTKLCNILSNRDKGQCRGIFGMAVLEGYLATATPVTWWTTVPSPRQTAPCPKPTSYQAPSAVPWPRTRPLYHRAPHCHNSIWRACHHKTDQYQFWMDRCPRIWSSLFLEEVGLTPALPVTSQLWISQFHHLLPR